MSFPSNFTFYKWCVTKVAHCKLDSLSINAIHMFNFSSLASQCAQHYSGERNVADSGEMLSGIVILSLVLAPVREPESLQDKMPQHLSMYN